MIKEEEKKKNWGDAWFEIIGKLVVEVRPPSLSLSLFFVGIRSG